MESNFKNSLDGVTNNKHRYVAQKAKKQTTHCTIYIFPYTHTNPLYHSTLPNELFAIIVAQRYLLLLGRIVYFRVIGTNFFPKLISQTSGKIGKVRIFSF